MALRSHDGTLADFSDGSFDDIWQYDLSPPTVMSHGSVSPTDDMSGSDSMDPAWLDLLFDDPILNDRMISDALEPHVVQSEHSYSIGGSTCKMETVIIKEEPMDKDYEIDVLGTDSPAASHDEKCQMSFGYQQETDSKTEWKCESMDDQSYGTTASTYYTPRPSPTSGRQTLLKQPVGLLQPVARQQHEPVRLHNVDIHLELVKSECSGQGQYGLPPTPPSSSTSDSEGGQSPQRSAPSSPSSRQSARSSPRSSSSQSVFISPINSAGMLVLTEEEKRTLIAEGYPIPSKLPLSKADERNLKKVRRKIKNKISAQESRRKKKEYMECLEKRMEGYSRENEGLRKKVDYLESTNRSLMSQLQKLQNLVARMPRPSSQSTQTGTCLMVLVLFFSVFLGSWSPMSWSIGSFQTASSANVPLPISRMNLPLTKPEAIQPMINDYATTNVRSRFLLAVHDDPEDDYEESFLFGPQTPASGKEYFMGLFSGSFLSCGVASINMDSTKPELPEISMETQINERPSDISEKNLAPRVEVVNLLANGTVIRQDTQTNVYFHHCEISANCSA